MNPHDAVHPAPIASPLQPSPAPSRVGVGDVVRMARANDGAWFYCEVDAILDDGAVMCSVIEAQDWPNLMMDGVLPGRHYTVPGHYVLSVVRPARAVPRR